MVPGRHFVDKLGYEGWAVTVCYAPCFCGLYRCQRFRVWPRNSNGQAPALDDASQKQTNRGTQVQSCCLEYGCSITRQLWLHPGAHINSHHDEILYLQKDIAMATERITLGFGLASEQEIRAGLGRRLQVQRLVQGLSQAETPSSRRASTDCISRRPSAIR